MITVSMVPAEYIDTCWSKISGFLDKAADYTYGRYKVDDIYDSITDYGYHLWVAYDNDEFKGAVVTNFMSYPQRKVLCMTFCGGENLAEWKTPMLELLQRFAWDTGCDGIEATARPGWAKVFQADGYKRNWVTFELPIQGAKHG